jgi:hypothetical protein
MIDKNHPSLSVGAQCRLLAISRSSFYYELMGETAMVISPFLTGCIRRTYAAIFSFMAGVMPPMPMLGRSLL